MKNGVVLKLLALVVLMGCEPKTSREDVQLNELIANEQLIANNNFVNSMRAQLEFFGAPADEGKFYSYSSDIVKLRNQLLNKSEGLIIFSDTVDFIYNKYKNDADYKGLRDPWDDSMEHLHQHFKKILNDEFDSVTYFKLSYTALKKEYALHMFNAQKLPN